MEFGELYKQTVSVNLDEKEQEVDEKGKQYSYCVAVSSSVEGLLNRIFGLLEKNFNLHVYGILGESNHHAFVLSEKKLSNDKVQRISEMQKFFLDDELQSRIDEVLDKGESVDEKGKQPKKKTRGRCVFPAEHSSVTDDADHYPINDADQARNALARVAQHDASPKWYKGSLKSLQNAVQRAVKKAYPSIEVSEGKEEEVDKRKKVRRQKMSFEKLHKRICEETEEGKGVREEDLKKLEPLVRKELAKDFVGNRLNNAVNAVTKGILRNFPDILTDKEDGYPSKSEESWEEFVFDAAAREGY